MTKNGEFFHGELSSKHVRDPPFFAIHRHSYASGINLEYHSHNSTLLYLSAVRAIVLFYTNAWS